MKRLHRLIMTSNTYKMSSTVDPKALTVDPENRLLTRMNRRRLEAEAIRDSPAIKVFVCNLMTQANESLGRTAADHIRALNEHADCQLFDYALINRTPASPDLKAKYALEGASQIVADLEAIEALGVCPVLGDYLFEDNVARHNTERVAEDLLQVATQAVSAKSSARS